MMQGSTAACDWGHLPAVAVQAIAQHCCPASTARLRLTCSAWHQALATQFSTLFLGPGDPTWCSLEPTQQHQQQSGSSGSSQQQPQPQHVPAWVLGGSLHRSFPTVSLLQLTASSSREYEDSFTQDLAQLLASQRRLTQLTLHEVHELEELDTLDPASLWDVLHAALPLLAGRLRVLTVLGCFWNQPELFGGLRQLTCLTELRLSNTPLETAQELRVVACMTQLVHLELGIIFDGSNAHHDVPRAVESLGDLQQLQALSLPMWRRSLGGRAHPLAPALSAALQKLSGLTNLAVDGKFSQLAIVSSLTNLRQLASAAPLSKEGWQAICQLPRLTLLTSLTPALEVLQFNPQRPHPGCDLAHLLAPRASLAGMDVAVQSPEHLAPLAQFSALQQLNLRCAATFQQPQQQAQVLTAMACLPPGLTHLSLGPLLPLCPQLFNSIASSCSGLRTLHASFTHKATGGSGAVTAAAAVAGAAGAAAGYHAGGVAAGAGAGGALQDQQPQWPYDVQGSSSSNTGDPMDADLQPALQPQQQQQQQQQGPLSVSQALSCLRHIFELELVLLSDVERSESPTLPTTAATRRSSSYGGALGSPPGVAAPPAAAAAAGSSSAFAPAAAGSSWPLSAAAAAGSAAAASPSAPTRHGSAAEAGSGSGGFGGGSSGLGGSSRTGGLVQLQLEQLPKSLKHLKLSGSWQLCYQGQMQQQPAPAAAGSPLPSDQQQQQLSTERVCSVCKGKRASQAAAAAAAAAGLAAGAAAAGPSSAPTAASLCDCMQGLRLSAAADKQPGSGLDSSWLARQLQKQAAASPLQQQQVPAWPKAPPAGKGSNRSSFSSSGGGGGSGPGSPARPVPLSGLKRPASHPSSTQQQVPSILAAAAAAAAAGGSAASGNAGAGEAAGGDVAVGDSSATTAAAHSGPLPSLAQDDEDSLLEFELQQGLAKRSRSFTSITAAAAGAAGAVPAAQPAAAGLVSSSDAAQAEQQQQQLLPQLSELCLFRVQVSYAALSALTRAAGILLSKLQLLQLSVTEDASRHQAGQPASSSPSKQQQQRGPGLPRPSLSISGGYLTTRQLLSLPVAWPCLQELHIHPYHLWGLLSAGCLAPAAPAAAGGSSSSQQQQQQQQGDGDDVMLPLQHVGQLLNLRHLYVVNVPLTFAAAAPPHPMTPPALAARIPSVGLPLHDESAMTALLSALQAGLQRLPALRQLLLYMGPATPLVELPDDAGGVWLEMGEALLQALPAVRVRSFRPSIHLPRSVQAAAAVQEVQLPAAAGGGGGGLVSGQ